MDWLEGELREALARKQPSPEFFRRVRTAAHREPVRIIRRWLTAAAALVVITGSGMAWRHHQGIAAKRDVMLALRISAAKLNHIQAHVREVNP